MMSSSLSSSVHSSSARGVVSFDGPEGIAVDSTAGAVAVDCGNESVDVDDM